MDTEAVWTRIGQDGFNGKLAGNLAMPRMIYRGNDAYLVFWRGYAVYHLEGDRLRACAAILVDKNENDEDQAYMWRDLNGDGQVQGTNIGPTR